MVPLHAYAYRNLPFLGRQLAHFLVLAPPLMPQRSPLDAPLFGFNNLVTFVHYSITLFFAKCVPLHR